MRARVRSSSPCPARRPTARSSPTTPWVAARSAWSRAHRSTSPRRSSSCPRRSWRAVRARQRRRRRSPRDQDPSGRGHRHQRQDERDDDRRRPGARAVVERRQHRDVDQRTHDAGRAGAVPDPGRRWSRASTRRVQHSVVAMEVSSHAMSQHRVDGLEFTVAAFTNLSHEHLDYHGSMEEYFVVKSRLFTAGARAARRHLGRRPLRRATRDDDDVAGHARLASRRDRRRDVTAGARRSSGAGTWSTPRSLGDYNVDNSLIAMTIMSVLGADDAAIAAAMGDVDVDRRAASTSCAGPTSRSSSTTPTPPRGCAGFWRTCARCCPRVGSSRSSAAAATATAPSDRRWDSSLRVTRT